MTPTRRLTGKVAIISGAAQGMGASHVRTFIAEGAKVVACDVLEEAGNALAAELGDVVRFIRADVTKAEDWRRAVAVAEAFGPIDILVNNAGIFAMSPIDSVTEAEFRRLFEVNQLGTLLGMQAVLPSMRRAGGGSIINVSSVAGLAGAERMMSYVASKFAIRGMTKVAALELGRENIRVNSVHPGGVETPMTAGAPPPTRLPISRIAKADEVSKMMVYLASDESSFCTGSEFVIDGGYLASVGEVFV